MKSTVHTLTSEQAHAAMIVREELIACLDIQFSDGIHLVLVELLDRQLLPGRRVIAHENGRRFGLVFGDNEIRLERWEQMLMIIGELCDQLVNPPGGPEREYPTRPIWHFADL